ncbi:MAG TPA: response regulator transcription factor [Dehalococcoidia bacterium]|nr:response regulator transcription factor [Dehalococcoidia bacterium]
MAAMGVFVIEPNELDRRQVRQLLSTIDNVNLLGDSALVGAEVSRARPGLVLINAGLIPGQMAALQQLARELREVRYVFYHRRPNITTFLNSLSLPVCGLLSLNHLSSDEFVRSLRTVTLGGAVIEPIAAQELIEHLREAPAASKAAPIEAAALTERESEVLGYVRQGLANKEIAGRLQISLGTVRAHLRSIFRKLDVSSRTAAAMFASAAPINGRPAPQGFQNA